MNVIADNAAISGDSEAALPSPAKYVMKTSSLTASIEEEDGTQTHATTPQSPSPATAHTTTIVDEAQECLAQSLLMFLYADLRLLSATGRINTKFETLCIDSDRAPRTTAAEMAQLAGNPLPRDISSVNDRCEGVSPGQIMAILLVELREEIIAQRQRAKEQIKRQRQERRMRMARGLTEEDDEDEVEELDDDDDAGVLNKITDRKGRKEFEEDMHLLIRSYNQMLAQDLKGIPEVKLERIISNPLRRAGKHKSHRHRWGPGRLFSFDQFDDIGQGAAGSPGHEGSDEDGSKASQSSFARKGVSRAAKFAGSLLRKTSHREASGLTADGEEPREIEIPASAPSNNTTAVVQAPTKQPKLSLIQEDNESQEESEELETVRGGGQKAPLTLEKGAEKGAITGAETPEKYADSGAHRFKLSELLESMKGAKGAPSETVDFDVASLKSDPGPDQSARWSPGASGSNMRPPGIKMNGALTRQLTQRITTYVEQYREDHYLHNKYYIPNDDYETFAGAENVGNKMLQMTSSMNLSMSHLPEGFDPEKTLSEKEILDHMHKCIESRNIDSLDFMADFFRDDTISQTMVKSKAQVVWMQDWFPIKDCVYAISVDKMKKRVLVLFRGAITRADWSHAFDNKLKKAQNPVKEAYEGKKNFIKIHRGFHTYLFRIRKDTSTRKYDEIANKAYEYGHKMIGSDFTVTVNGYSLGGALSLLFGFYASTDERFTQNGPVKIFSYGAPYAVSNAFADAFRYQEKNRKVQHARFYNSNDIVAHLPFNVKPTQRGSQFVHVGIDVKLYPVPGKVSVWGSRYPRFHYNKQQSPLAAYWRALKLNSLLNMPFPWLIKNKHGLPELQARIARAILVAESAETRKYPFLRKTLDEAYEAMVHKKD